MTPLGTGRNEGNSYQLWLWSSLAIHSPPTPYEEPTTGKLALYVPHQVPTRRSRGRNIVCPYVRNWFLKSDLCTTITHMKFLNVWLYLNICILVWANDITLLSNYLFEERGHLKKTTIKYIICLLKTLHRHEIPKLKKNNATKELNNIMDDFSRWEVYWTFMTWKLLVSKLVNWSHNKYQRTLCFGTTPMWANM